MIEVGKVYVESVEVNNQMRIARHWKILFRVSDEICFCTNEEGRYDIKNPSKWKEGLCLADRREILKKYGV